MTSQHQLDDRLQVDGIGLDPPPALHPPLLADPRRTELHNLQPVGQTPNPSSGW
jgi:hypothetical protein